MMKPFGSRVACWQYTRTKEAIPELEKAASLMQRSPGALTMLSAAYACAGRHSEALRLINELKQRRKKAYVPPGSFVIAYLALRDYHESFFWFERAYAEQSSILRRLKTNPFFVVREDPRFQDLVRRVGLDSGGMSPPKSLPISWRADGYI